jgi:hypothetical protein
MKRSAFLVALVALASLSIAVAGGIKDGSLSAYSNGTNIVVRWISESEIDVRGYMVERRAGTDGPFIILTSPYLTAKGDGSSYEFVDNAAYRVTDNIYQYRITAVGNNATYYVIVNHYVSGVRRTWGSIKAMFR